MKLSRREFLDSIASLAADLRGQIESECSGFSIAPEERAERAKRATAPNGFEFFARTYFPHHLTVAEPSVLHQYLFAELPKIVDEKKGIKLALAAPRGEAKSTIVSMLFVLWCIITKRKHFIPIIMDAFEQAALNLEAIKIELESNPRLASDFPDVVGAGKVWNVGVIVTATGVKVQAYGAKKRIRGVKHGAYRPDLVILDDIENDENVATPEQRNKLESWLNKSVLKLGPPTGNMDVIYIGTILHYDSVLARTQKKPLWQSRTFKAILQWPEDMPLWDKWEEALRNSGEDAADAFYAQHKAALDKGAIVSWPAARPLLTLMKERADDHSAFDSEYQNDPINSEEAIFGELHFWVNRLDEWVPFGAVDPSIGKNRTADPSAILVGGYQREKGILDVLVADIKRRTPDKTISDVIQYQKEFLCLVWAVESVQFQEFFRTELIKRSAAARVPVPARPFKQHTDKGLRIESLQPHVANGLIRFHSSQITLLSQLRHYPKADHDDGPDALHMLWKIAVAGAGFEVPKTGSRKRSRHKKYYDSPI